MTTHVYVDGSGKPKSTYGYYVKETGVAKHFRGSDLTNNQAEYLAIIEVLKDPILQKADSLIIYSDSQNTVKQLNHEYAINDDALRELALQAWDLISKSNVKIKIQWIPRKINLAGKMLGS